MDRGRPAGARGEVRVRTLCVGVCGTDREILAGHYGTAPPGAQQLILGHESLGEVIEAPTGSGLAIGDLVVGIVRHPDPAPCMACASGEWDMCRNGLYTEHGIKERDGFCAEEFLIGSQSCVRLDSRLRETGVLLEPASVVAKAWDHIERIGARTRSWRPRTVLVTGAGTVGLLAALLAQQRGCELHVYDRQRGGMKRDLVVRLGGTYHHESIEHACSINPDVIVECTGASEVIAAIIGRNAPAGIVCLAGLSSGSHRLSFDFTAFNRSMVLENDVVFGSVNANRMHYELGATALGRADPGWLRDLITRRVALTNWRHALEQRPGDIKVVIDFTL
ncbi:MAG TPA: glucose 1-dehydrogenase [Steroidobacteraceae bacterium]|nr:glucose 1-dehydrogenase [Steroidobacteraceae bacterium]